MNTSNILLQAVVDALVQEVLKSEPIQLLIKATKDLHSAAGNKMLSSVTLVSDLGMSMALAQRVQQLEERVQQLEGCIPTPSVPTIAEYVLTHSAFIDGTKALVKKTLTDVGGNEIVQNAVGAYFDNTATLQERMESILTDGRNDTISDAVEACIKNGTFLGAAVDEYLDSSDTVEDAVKSFLSNANVSVNVG